MRLWVWVRRWWTLVDTWTLETTYGSSPDTSIQRRSPAVFSGVHLAPDRGDVSKVSQLQSDSHSHARAVLHHQQRVQTLRHRRRVPPPTDKKQRQIAEREPARARRPTGS